MAIPKRKTYVVFRGRVPGIYTNGLFAMNRFMDSATMSTNHMRMLMKQKRRGQCSSPQTMRLSPSTIDFHAPKPNEDNPRTEAESITHGWLSRTAFLLVALFVLLLYPALWS
ncbi:hypothetical protein PIB30_058896 [Stylosanthes scabra]|uniref:Uncharacterized protein n=1 Tax=Stylosanthes scabra TaxID=79078 RepID=A0ABU6ZIU9_9FABA|nr:hypothetical protein [Stylosanthes scabra]